MQNDTGRTFKETYGDAETLLKAIKEIKRLALVQRFDDAPLRVRLLTPQDQRQLDIRLRHHPTRYNTRG